MTKSLELPPLECLEKQRAHVMTGSGSVLIMEHLMLSQFSNLTKLLRVSAWYRRWFLKHVTTEENKTTKVKMNCPTLLSVTELNEVEKIWISRVQTDYRKKIAAITSGTPLPAKSSLIDLNPFRDHEEIVRVGGRLRHSFLIHEKKHSIILPAFSIFIRLIAESCHRKALHEGVQLTLSLVRQKYWILRGRSLIKSCIHRCIMCVRWRAAITTQQLADLLLTPKKTEASHVNSQNTKCSPTLQQRCISEDSGKRQ